MPGLFHCVQRPLLYRKRPSLRCLEQWLIDDMQQCHMLGLSFCERLKGLDSPLGTFRPIFCSQRILIVVSS